MIHFQDKDGNRYLYLIGGWNSDQYFSSVHRMAIGADGSGTTWEVFPQGIHESRGDHACQEAQIDEHRQGILVTGGYRAEGAWMATVEFLDYEKGSQNSTAK